MKSFHIAAYVFNADVVCCDCVSNWAEKELIEEGYSEKSVNEFIYDHPLEYDSGVFGYRSEILLRKLAQLWRINLEDEYSWDSDDFPKVVFADQIEDTKHCGSCHEEIP